MILIKMVFLASEKKEFEEGTGEVRKELLKIICLILRFDLVLPMQLAHALSPLSVVQSDIYE